MKLLVLLVVISCTLSFCVSSSDQQQQQQQKQIPYEELLQHLIVTKEHPNGKWVTKAEIDEELVRNKIKFMDITYHQDQYSSLENIEQESSLKSKMVFPKDPTHQDLVNKIIATLSVEDFTKNIEELAAFHNRYFRSQTGVDAAQHVRDKYLSLVPPTSNISRFFEVNFFNHTFIQPSVIARISGQGPNKNEVVIISAHLDSIDGASPSTGRAPGADDDASGVSVTFETLRALAKADFVPDRTIEFHAYAGEEGGLLGSQAIASYYKSRSVVVAAMLMMDQTSYWDGVAGHNVIGVLTDNVNPDLTAFLRKLVETYSTLKWSNTACGYPCSDHVPWYRQGYPTSLQTESEFRWTSPYTHSPRDTIDTLTPSHGLQLVRVSVGYAVELANA